MTGLTDLLIPFVSGLFLGIIYFSLLKFSLEMGLGSRRPVAVNLAAFFLRLGISALCFYYFAREGEPQPVIACAAGFFLMRFVMVRLLKDITWAQKAPAGGK
ncbi:MAG: hypothetical protein GF409_07590 [Candidatus Omnitrophica bacterium]|nr:hypothetical protein [Candidatus Omnitrophota bacterium]